MPGADLRLKVATYNIHGGIGRDGRLDLGRIARVLKVGAPDVMGLNEVYRFPGEVGQEEALAREMGEEWHAVFGKTIDKPLAEYGNAILTRLPVESSETWSLDEWPKQERRGVLRVTVQKYGRPVHVFCTHMGLASAMRIKNAEQLLSIMGKFDGEKILLGDFNEVLPAVGLNVIADAGFTDAWRSFGLGAGKTFPSRPALRRLDYIWLSRGLAAESCYVAAWADARVASDHRPVFASVVGVGEDGVRVDGLSYAQAETPAVPAEPAALVKSARLAKSSRPIDLTSAAWKRLSDVRRRGEAAGTGAIEEVGGENFYRQKSDGTLLMGQGEVKIPSDKLARHGSDPTDWSGAMEASARVQTVTVGAGWVFGIGDVAVKVRHEDGRLPFAELLVQGDAVTSVVLSQVGIDPYVWNGYSLLAGPVERDSAGHAERSVGVFVNGVEVLVHSGARQVDLGNGVWMKTKGGAGWCEILADDVVVRGISAEEWQRGVAAVIRRWTPKIIRTPAGRAERWWDDLW